MEGGEGGGGDAEEMAEEMAEDDECEGGGAVCAILSHLHHPLQAYCDLPRVWRMTRRRGDYDVRFPKRL